MCAGDIPFILCTSGSREGLSTSRSLEESAKNVLHYNSFEKHTCQIYKNY